LRETGPNDDFGQAAERMHAPFVQLAAHGACMQCAKSLDNYVIEVGVGTPPLGGLDFGKPEIDDLLVVHRFIIFNARVSAIDDTADRRINAETAGAAGGNRTADPGSVGKCLSRARGAGAPRQRQEQHQAGGVQVPGACADAVGVVQHFTLTLVILLAGINPSRCSRSSQPRRLRRTITA